MVCGDRVCLSHIHTCVPRMGENASPPPGRCHGCLPSSPWPTQWGSLGGHFKRQLQSTKEIKAQQSGRRQPNRREEPCPGPAQACDCHAGLSWPPFHTSCIPRAAWFLWVSVSRGASAARNRRARLSHSWEPRTVYFSVDPLSSTICQLHLQAGSLQGNKIAVAAPSIM